MSSNTVEQAVNLLCSTSTVCSCKVIYMGSFNSLNCTVSYSDGKRIGIKQRKPRGVVRPKTV